MHDHLRDLVAAYDAHAGEREAAGEPEWRFPIRVEFTTRLPAAGRILEIGAGVGYTSRWFAEQGFDVIATDLSPENVARCRAKGLTAHVRDMRSLGFGVGSFDGVWAASCLMHIPGEQLADVLGGIRDVLVSGGIFWAGTWGGADREGIWKDDRYEPKRFYAHRSDERLRSMYASVFDIDTFDVMDVESAIEWHYQSVFMKRS